MSPLQLPVDRVHEVLDGVLARPEFAPPSPAPLWRALEGAWDWIWSLLGDLLEWLAPGLMSAPGGWATAGRVALVVLGLVGVAALVHLARLAAAGVTGVGRRGAGAEDGDPGSDPAGADDWEAAARKAAEEGRWREAVTALYQAVIHRLGQAGRLRLEPGKTPGDYRRELRGDPRVGPLLDRFVRRWEPVAFGRRDADPGAWAELLGLARALERRG